MIEAGGLGFVPSRTVPEKREREKEDHRRKREIEKEKVITEIELARVPAPRVFPREPNSLSQANVTIDHRSQITEKREKRNPREKGEKERDNEKER